MAHLRTHHGLDLPATRAAYLAELQANGWVTIHNEVLTLTDAGKLLADHITLELFETTDLTDFNG